MWQSPHPRAICFSPCRGHGLPPRRGRAPRVRAVSAGAHLPGCPGLHHLHPLELWPGTWGTAPQDPGYHSPQLHRAREPRVPPRRHAPCTPNAASTWGGGGATVCPQSKHMKISFPSGNVPTSKPGSTGGALLPGLGPHTSNRCCWGAAAR